MKTAQCTMNIKKLSQILNTGIIGNSKYVVGCKLFNYSSVDVDLFLWFLIGIVKEHAFVLYAELGQNLGSATFYIPILFN